MHGGRFFVSELIGWICWSVLALAGAVITWAAICDAINQFNEWRWRKSEPVIEQRDRAVYR